MPTMFKGSFNAGVISPRLGGKIDLAKYESALDTCENAMPQPWGGVARRMGTEFINECSVHTSRSRLIPFRYSTDQAYIIEMGDGYMRFYMDGGLIQTNDASTVALLHMDGLDGSTSFSDDSTYHKTVTAHGGANIDASDGVFNQCATFNGTAAYLSMADSADWNMQTAPFSIDCRVKFSALPADNEAMVIANQRENGNVFATFALKNLGGTYSLQTLINNSSALTCPADLAWATPATDTWYHIAFLRGWNSDDDTWSACVEGVSLGTATSAAEYPNVASVFQVGRGSEENYYPPVYSLDYVKATTAAYQPYFATNPAIPLTGTEVDQSWLSNLVPTNQRFHVDLGYAIIITKIYYENFHHFGGDTTKGVKDFTFWGSNDAADFAATNYASVGTWTQINTSTTMFTEHIAADTADPKYITAYNDTPYRYYGFKFANNHGGPENMGARRIELKPPKNIPFNGLIDEFRVSKNVARWTADFTPSTVAFPLGTSGGNEDYSISSPYTESDLRDVYYVQSADTLYPTHPDYAPRTLVRAAHDDWTLSTITFAWPPFRSQNTTSTYLSPNAASVGAVSINASSSLFDDTYVGSYLKLNSGYMNIASVQTATTCSGTIIDEFTNSSSTASWAISAWDAISGYPSCVTFFEQRLCYAATDADEATVWMSVSGDYYNFNAMVASSIADTDACTYSIDADEVNRIMWMGSAAKLFLGTAGDVFMMSGNQDDGITPTNIKCRSTAAERSKDETMPVRFGNSILFAESGGKILRELAYDFQEDSYKAKDLIILAEHLTRNNTIIEIALQRLPYKVVWCVLDDGKVLSLTYLKEHDVVGWTWHDFGGTAESVAVIPGTTDDEVWFIMNRTIGGATKRYIERLVPQFTGEAEEDAFYVDCGLTYDGVSATSIAGLSHLAGETVSYLADGIINESTAITAGGVLVMDTAASVVQVGLPMTTSIETLRVSPAQYQGKPKRISYVTIRFYETAGEVQIGVSGKEDTVNLGTSLYSGDYRFTFPSGYDKDGQISITKTDAYPMTILAIVPDIEMYRD